MFRYRGFTPPFERIEFPFAVEMLSGSWKWIFVEGECGQSSFPSPRLQGALRPSAEGEFLHLMEGFFFFFLLNALES